MAWKRSHYFNRYVCLNNTANHGLLPCLRAQRHPFPPPPCCAMCDVNSLTVFLFEKGFRTAKLHCGFTYFTRISWNTLKKADRPTAAIHKTRCQTFAHRSRGLCPMVQNSEQHGQNPQQHSSGTKQLYDNQFNMQKPFGKHLRWDFWREPGDVSAVVQTDRNPGEVQPRFWVVFIFKICFPKPCVLLTPKSTFPLQPPTLNTLSCTPTLLSPSISHVQSFSLKIQK